MALLIIAYPCWQCDGNGRSSLSETQFKNMSTSNMDQPFPMHSDWLCCPAWEARFWANHGRSGEVPEFVDTWAAKIGSPVDLESPYSSSTPSGATSWSSAWPASFSLGRASSAVPDLVQDANVAFVPPESFSFDQSSSSSYVSDSHVPMRNRTPPSGPYFASTIVGSPERFESERLFAADGEPYYEAFLSTDLSSNSSITSSNDGPLAREELLQSMSAEVGGRESRTFPGAPGTPKSSSTSENESTFVCQVCQRKYKHKSSLLRHMKEKCRREGEKGPFQCNPHFHPGCKKRFQRRCGLRDHYKRLKLTEKQAVAKVREKYPKGMHSRSF